MFIPVFEMLWGGIVAYATGYSNEGGVVTGIIHDTPKAIHAVRNMIMGDPDMVPYVPPKPQPYVSPVAGNIPHPEPVNMFASSPPLTSPLQDMLANTPPAPAHPLAHLVPNDPAHLAAKACIIAGNDEGAQANLAAAATPGSVAPVRRGNYVM